MVDGPDNVWCGAPTRPGRKRLCHASVARKLCWHVLVNRRLVLLASRPGCRSPSSSGRLSVAHSPTSSSEHTLLVTLFCTPTVIAEPLRVRPQIWVHRTGAMGSKPSVQAAAQSRPASAHDKDHSQRKKHRPNEPSHQGIRIFVSSCWC